MNKLKKVNEIEILRPISCLVPCYLWQAGKLAGLITHRLGRVVPAPCLGCTLELALMVWEWESCTSSSSATVYSIGEPGLVAGRFLPRHVGQCWAICPYRRQSWVARPLPGRPLHWRPGHLPWHWLPVPGVEDTGSQPGLVPRRDPCGIWECVVSSGHYTTQDR